MNVLLQGGQSESDSYHGNKMPGAGAVPKDRERKIGHRRVDEKTGTVTYKKVKGFLNIGLYLEMAVSTGLTVYL